MFRRLGLTIAYFVAVVYIIWIVCPALYCYQHGCRAGGEGDIFMPAFFLTPVGAIATAFAFRNAIQNIRKGHTWSWLFWPLAVVFGIVLAAVIVFIAIMVYYIVVANHTLHR